MSVELRGLDGSNPMGLFAAVGVLVGGSDGWRLGWRDDGTWAPYLEGPSSEEEVIDVLDQNRARWGDDSILTSVLAADIKMPRAEFRALARALVGRAEAPWLGVLGNEVVLDGSGKNIKPSALHFSAGQQKFLTTAREIRGWASELRLSEAQLEGALFSSWRRVDNVKSFGWDASISRDYALRFRDPSKDKKLTEAAAEWLAFMGLSAFPSAPRHGKLLTACVGGSWKHGWFRWPLWSAAASLSAIRALLSEKKLAGLPRHEAAARGIFAVLVSRIGRSDQGGYGTFSPSRPAAADDDPR